MGKTKRLKHLDPDQVTFMRRTVELLRHEGVSAELRLMSL